MRDADTAADDGTPIRFRCGGCGTKLKAPAAKVGREVGCPGCLARLAVPVPPPPDAPAHEVDLAEADDEQDPPVRTKWPKPQTRRRERDDGIPIRRDDWDYDDRPRRRANDWSGLPLAPIIMTGAGFFLGCVGTCLAGPRNGDAVVRLPFSLVAAAGSLSLLSGTIWAAVAWAYHGAGGPVKLYRVGAILGLSLMMVFAAVYPMILAYR